MNAVKRLLKVRKIYIYSLLPFVTLLNDIAKYQYLLSARSSAPKTHLFLLQLLIHVIFQSVEQYTTEYLAWYR